MLSASRNHNPAIADPSGPIPQSIPIAALGAWSEMKRAGSTPQYEAFTQTSFPVLRESTS